MKFSEDLIDDLTNLRRSVINPEGKEVLNPRPLFLDTERVKIDSREEIRRLIRNEMSIQALYQENESFEESDDFLVEDEFDLNEMGSPYNIKEEDFVPMKREVIHRRQEEEENKNGDKKRMASIESGPDSEERRDNSERSKERNGNNEADNREISEEI